ncbi:MAG: hypothetical protein WCO25_04045 [Candidatus Uhrbacteria bacterium]
MKNLYAKLGAGLSMLPVLATPFMASAALSGNPLGDAANDVTTIGSTAGLSQANSLPTMIGNVIQVLLGVLGIVFVVLVVYAGFLYLTSAGEDKGVGKAKKLLTQAVIGLIIIVSAYAISGYVIAALVNIAA